MDTAEILIVDDEPINLTVLRNLLTRHYIVRACKSGSDALSLIASGRRPDLILLDIIMPGLSGYDTLTRLRETEENRDIPVIFITAFPQRLLTGERPEPAFLITKPYSEEQVRSAVSQAMFFASTEDMRV